MDRQISRTFKGKCPSVNMFWRWELGPDNTNAGHAYVGITGLLENSWREGE